MRIAVLTHAEAADSAVFANLAKHLLSGADTISYVDRPDVGLTLPATAGAVSNVPLALGQPTATPSPAAAVFGGQAVPAAPAVVPPVPSVPSAATAPTAAPAAPAGVVVDAAGLPWDARIHSSNKAFVADGTWRQRRGTDPALLTKVEAELRQTMGLPAATPAPTAAPVPQPPVANSAFGAAAIAAGLPQPVLVPPAPTGEPTTMAEFMLWLTPHMPHKVSNEHLVATLQANGVPSLNSLISRPDLVPTLVAQLKPLLG